MDEARLALIIAAIMALKPEEDFTKAGTPNLASLKATISDITAAERDEAWAKIQADKPAEPAAETPAPEAKETILTGETALKNMRAQGYRV